MKRRIKKPSVKPELRQEWLRRYESGETPPKIADSNNYDVRTVRKHIDLARQERDVREARSAVLRGALEQHYRDMYDLALELDSHLVSRHAVSLDSEVDRRLFALRQHLSRSPLWTNFLKWNRTIEEIDELEEAIKQRLEDELRQDEELDRMDSVSREAIIVGLIPAFAFQIREWSQERPGHNAETDIYIEEATEDECSIRYGSHHMHPFSRELAHKHEQPVRSFVKRFELEMRKWEQYQEMKNLFNGLHSLKRRLRDELAITIMRRIVPGRCKYCPL